MNLTGTLPFAWAVTAAVSILVFVFAVTVNIRDRRANLILDIAFRALVARWRAEDDAADRAARIEAARAGRSEQVAS